MENDEKVISASILIFLISIFNIICLRYILGVKHNVGPQPLYERSELLLIFANISNFCESLLNISVGLLMHLSNSTPSGVTLGLFLLSIYFTRLYACCMGLRIYRIKYLYRQRSQIIKPWKKCFESKTCLSAAIINIYSVSAMLGFFLIHLFESDKRVIDYFNRSLYCVEALGMFIMSYKYYSIAQNPSISVEYVFYSIIWIAGILGSGEGRFFYQEPIRNSALLFISVLSIFVHADMIRPPLPSDIGIVHVFEIQELYEDFSKFLEVRGNDREVEACRIFRDLAILEELKVVNKEQILCAFQNSKNFSTNSIDEASFIDAKDCIENVLVGALKIYLNSNEHKKMKSDYFIYFN